MTITFSAIVASTAQDPTVYNSSALQIARAICEIWSLGMTIFILVTEINQIRKCDPPPQTKKKLEKFSIEIITKT